MLKLIGILLIGTGVGLGLLEWRWCEIDRQRRLEELSFLFGRAEYALEKEQQPLIDFFRSAPVEEPLLALCLSETAELLEENTCPDGRMAWEKAFAAHKREWRLSTEEWNSLLASGRAFFGKNRQELRRLLAVYGQRMERYYMQEKERFAQRQRVALPLGLLGSLMLIVILM